MKVQEIDINKLKEYGNNPRHNDEAVQGVAKSIKEFGFKVPIVVDKDNIIIAGHTRYKASRKLGLERVPCIIADDLTDEQVKAFRLADNKVSEKATWNEDLLKLELDSIEDIAMIDFGFENIGTPFMELETVEEVPKDERERTMNSYNLNEYDSDRAIGFYQMPLIKKTYYKPKNLIGFNYVKTTPPDNGVGVHFFIDDYQFERVWNTPQDYINKLCEYDCVLTPDFSLYTEMPIAMKIWNVYRSRLIGQMLQDAGALVIPTLQWAEKETFSFCFDGIEQGGTVAVSTIGVKKDSYAYDLWENGMNEAIKIIKPRTVIVYGGDIGYKYPCDVVYINNSVVERMRSDG